MKKIILFLASVIIVASSFAAGHVVSIASLTMVTCFGNCDGSATVSVSGGIGPFSFLWAPGPGGVTTAYTSGLCPGTYTVTATDSSDMSTAFVTITITEPSALAIAPMSPSLICFGDCTTITPSVSGGTPPYAYIWTGYPGPSSLSVCPATITTYTLTVTDANGCYMMDVATVPVNPPIVSGISSVNASSCGVCDGSANVTPFGGSGTFVAILWSNGSTAPTTIALCDSTYSATIWDTNGCTTTDSTTIYSANDLIANCTMVPDSTDPYNFFAFNSSTGAGNSYDWSWGDGTPNSTTTNPSHTWTSIGIMTVCLTASNFLCGADTLCKTVNVTGVLNSCNALFNIADDTLNPDPNAHYVYNLSYGATLTYLWDFGDGTTSNSMTPSHVYSGTGPYLLCLSADNGAGCTDMYCDSLISADSLNRSSGTMQLVVYDVPPFQTSTAGISNQANLNSISVSPNPFNDITLFEIKSTETEIYSFELTDVLGKKVKSKEGISEKQFEISREGLQNGIYFYKVYTSESIVGIGKVVIK